MAGSRGRGRAEHGEKRGRAACAGRPSALLAALACAAFAAGILAAPRPAVADTADDLDAYLEEAFAASGIPGMAVAVVDADGIDYLRAFGDVESLDDTFIVGSLSKSMTSLAIQQLVDQGRVDLDAPAALYAPGYGVPLEVTVRSLLNQTSGFGYYESLLGATVGESFGSFSYANANYDLLGRIVEAVSGMDYADYLRIYVFDAAGMDDASVDGAGEARSGSAAGHRNWFGLAVADGFAHAEDDDAWGGQASGYVRASIRDMANYLRLYLNSGGEVASSEAIDRMVWDRVPDEGGDTFYGMGWTTFDDEGGDLVMSHDGDVENYVARMVVIPGLDVGVVLLADENDALGGNAAFWDIGDGVLSIALGGDADAGEVAWDAGAARAYHARLDAAYALAMCAAAAPLALRRRWARRLAAADGPERGVRAVMAVGLHAGVPVWVASLPGGLGMRARDFADFYPEQALVGGVCVALLLAGGAAKALAARHVLLSGSPRARRPGRPAAQGGSGRGRRT
ncbi:MAG: serine hydrolase domain-containing protein [Coriobacteriia bacterium]|nr:serine hydrolase domain-containing protein [Coriobacteriia bacterium]